MALKSMGFNGTFDPFFESHSIIYGGRKYIMQAEFFCGSHTIENSSGRARLLIRTGICDYFELSINECPKLSLKLSSREQDNCEYNIYKNSKNGR